MSTALDDILASVTVDNIDSILAAILGRATEVRKAAELDDAALLAAIGARVSSLRSSAAVATTDQATASDAADAETANAAAVKASAPALTVAYLTAVRDQIAQIHTMFAGLQTWRAQMDGDAALVTTATADLATVVATKL